MGHLIQVISDLANLFITINRPPPKKTPQKPRILYERNRIKSKLLPVWSRAEPIVPAARQSGLSEC